MTEPKTVYITKNIKIHADIDCPYLRTTTQVVAIQIVNDLALGGLDLCELCYKPEELAAKRNAWRHRRVH